MTRRLSIRAVPAMLRLHRLDVPVLMLMLMLTGSSGCDAINCRPKPRLDFVSLASPSGLCFCWTNDEWSRTLKMSNKVLRQLAQLTPSAQKQLELEFVGRVIAMRRAGRTMYGKDDYGKLNVIRIWEGKPPLILSSNSCWLLKGDGYSDLIDVSGPHAEVSMESDSVQDGLFDQKMADKLRGWLINGNSACSLSCEGESRRELAGSLLVLGARRREAYA